MLIFGGTLTISIFNIAEAQLKISSTLNIGDPAPALDVQQWIKGSPVQTYERGRIYVLEYWATWCKPCKAAMPHLSELARHYKKHITVIGIDAFEMATSTSRIKSFVDSMGRQMDYAVAMQDSSVAVKWFEASGEQGIPKTFIVDAEGRVAWIGHPSQLGPILSQMVHGKWNVKEEAAKRQQQKYLAALDDSLFYELLNYDGNWYRQDYIGKPDSALLFIAEQVRMEPKLKYAPRMAFHTFNALLKTNQLSAYDYGKVAMITPVYEEPAYGAIIAGIENYSDKLNLSAEMYLLGAEAYQFEIDHTVYPELVNISKRYNRMAEWYWRAGKKCKAIKAQRGAIESLKSKKQASGTELALLESRLQFYRSN